MTKTIYILGDMLSHGQQLRRAYEKSAFKELGYNVHNPQDDKSINDKANADQQGLAERIVANDTAGIESADIIVADYLTHAQGSICELGYIQKLKRDKPELKVYVHCTDVRQGTGHIPTEQDRAEFSINQYVYGVILEITEGRGIQDFEEIRQELDNETFGVKEQMARQLRHLARCFEISDSDIIAHYESSSDGFGQYEEIETVGGVTIRIEREAK